MSKRKKKETRGRKQTDLATLAGDPDKEEGIRIAKRIRRLRARKRLTVVQAAAKTRISFSHWYRIERAGIAFRPKRETLEQIAAVLGTTFEALRK